MAPPWHQGWSLMHAVLILSVYTLAPPEINGDWRLERKPHPLSLSVDAGSLRHLPAARPRPCVLGSWWKPLGA